MLPAGDRMQIDRPADLREAGRTHGTTALLVGQARRLPVESAPLREPPGDRFQVGQQVEPNDFTASDLERPNERLAKMPRTSCDQNFHVGAAPSIALATRICRLLFARFLLAFSNPSYPYTCEKAIPRMVSEKQNARKSKLQNRLQLSRPLRERGSGVRGHSGHDRPSARILGGLAAGPTFLHFGDHQINLKSRSQACCNGRTHRLI